MSSEKVFQSGSQTPCSPAEVAVESSDVTAVNTAANSLEDVSKFAQPVDSQKADRSPEKAEDKLSSQTNFLPPRLIITIFLALSLALFTSFLDQTLVATALPQITSSFNSGNKQASWIPTAYLVASTAFQPAVGRLSDVIGRKAMLLSSLAIFIVGSALSTAAQSLTQLIIFRAFAGIGSGSVQSLTMVIVSDIVSLRDRGKYQGILGIVNALGNSVGPLLGGALAVSHPLGWRSVMLVSVPLNFATAALVVFLLPFKPVTGSAKEKLKRIDYGGINLVLVATVLCLLGLNWAGSSVYSWSSAHVLAPLILSGVLFTAFVLWEWRVPSLPIIPLRIFGNVTVTAVIIQTCLSGCAMYVQLFFVPQMLQVLKGYSGVKAGVALIPLAALQSLGSAFCGYLVSYFGRYKIIILAGLGIYAIGIGLLTTVTRHTHLGLILVYCIIGGLGAGGSTQTSLVAAQCAVERKDMAVVTSVRNFSRLFGGTLGLAISYVILNTSVKNLAVADYDTVQDITADPTALMYGLPQLDDPTRDLFQDAYTEGFERVFYMVLVSLLVGFVVTLFGMTEYSLERKDDAELKSQGKQAHAIEKSKTEDVEAQK